MTHNSIFVKTPAHRQKIQKLLANAIGHGDAPRVKRLLEQGADPALPFGPLMSTPLMDAASMGSAELIALFLPFSDIAQTDAHGRTPLFLLVNRLGHWQGPEPAGWREAMSSLLSKETAQTKTSQGASPLLHAAKRWSSNAIDIHEIIAILSPFSDLSSTDASGLTSTALALGCHKADAISRALALFDADPDQERCLALPGHALGRSLAHVAAIHNRVDFLSEIAPRVDLDAFDADGRTPLMASVADIDPQSFSCMDFLLANGANPLCVDHDGCDALMLGIEAMIVGFNDAQWHRLIPLAEKSNLLSRDNLGESAFDKAIDRGLLALADAIQALAGPAMGRFPPPQDSTLPTTQKKLHELLHAAIILGRLDLVDKRLRQGADPQARDAYSSSALMLACVSQNEQIIRRLIPLSDLLCVDSKGNNALIHFLASKEIDSPERLSLMSELIPPHASAHINREGASPLGRARPSPAFRSATMNLLGAPDGLSALSASGETILNFDGDMDCLAILAAHPDPERLLSVANAEGKTAFHLAAIAGRLPFLTATASRASLVAVDLHGHTPLMSACSDARAPRGPSHPVAALLAPWSECRAVDDCGCDALMLAIEAAFDDHYDLLETVQILIPLSDLQARDFLGESALDKALARGFERSAGALLARLAIDDERETLAAALSTPAPPIRTSARI